MHELHSKHCEFTFLQGSPLHLDNLLITSVHKFRHLAGNMEARSKHSKYLHNTSRPTESLRSMNVQIWIVTFIKNKTGKIRMAHY